MDPIEHINVHKDSTLAMLIEAQQRAYEVNYIKPLSLFQTDTRIMAQLAKLSINLQSENWFEMQEFELKDLREFDIVLMRKDPPFNMEYIYTTFLLERLHEQGTLVINNPVSLRNANEKLFATRFPQCTPPYIVTSDNQLINDFIEEQQEVVVKPLDGMAGESIFKIQDNDPNRNAILESITQKESITVMAQKFIPEYKKGDKRILLIEGEPIPYALVRIPADGEFRANLARGGTPEGARLTERDLWICNQIKAHLIAMQLSFVGIDVIGEFLTEINITSPTGIRELDKMYNLNICATLFDAIEKRLDKLH